jgi:hypothetical protein
LYRDRVTGKTLTLHDADFFLVWMTASDYQELGDLRDMKVFLTVLVVLAICAASLASDIDTKAQPFSDVPASHWAAPAVAQLTAEGVMKGYPDSTFRGDKPVTRYELAVALARFVEFIEAARKPIVPEKQEGDKASEANCPAWTKSSMATLTLGRFLPSDSPIIRDGAKPVTEEDLSKALSSMAARIIEMETPKAVPSDDR